MWGLIGVGGFVFLGLLIAQIGTKDAYGCEYNWLNHAISELGGVGHSWSWWLFSFCLIVGGIFSCFYVIGLGFYIEGKITAPLAKLAMASGLFCCVSMMGVGVFPYDVNLQWHMYTAGAFFASAMVTPIICSIAIFLQNRGPGNQKIPRWAGFLGFGVAAVGYMFSRQSIRQIYTVMERSDSLCREGVIAVAFWEWMVFYTVSLWLIVFAILTRKKGTKKILNF